MTVNNDELTDSPSVAKDQNRELRIKLDEFLDFVARGFVRSGTTRKQPTVDARAAKPVYLGRVSPDAINCDRCGRSADPRTLEHDGLGYVCQHCKPRDEGPTQ